MTPLFKQVPDFAVLRKCMLVTLQSFTGSALDEATALAIVYSFYRGIRGSAGMRWVSVYLAGWLSQCFSDTTQIDVAIAAVAKLCARSCFVLILIF